MPDDPRRPRHQGRRRSPVRARSSTWSTWSCQFEGDRHARLRLVRATKNRYGPTDEVGCFDLTDDGIVGLADPSGLFLSQRHRTGARHAASRSRWRAAARWLAEVQALVASEPARHPRRTTSGLDSSRVAMVLAVLQRAGRLHARRRATSTSSTVGGVRIAEPAADLAVALALASAATDRAAADRPGRVRRGRAGRRDPAGRRHRAPAGRGRPAGLHARARAAGAGPRAGAGARREVELLGSRRSARLDGHSRWRPLARRQHAARSRTAAADVRSGPWHARARRRPRLPLTRPSAAVAPGTALRDGLERILRGRTGGLIVLGYDRTVEAMCTGGFVARRRVLRDPAARAGQDGRRRHPRPRRHPDRARRRAAAARPDHRHRRSPAPGTAPPSGSPSRPASR